MDDTRPYDPLYDACRFCGYAMEVGSHGAITPGDQFNMVTVQCRVPKDAVPQVVRVLTRVTEAQADVQWPVVVRLQPVDGAVAHPYYPTWIDRLGAWWRRPTFRKGGCE